MKFSKQIQRVLAAMLCLTLFAALLTVNPVNVQAAKTKKITLYLGEQDVFYHVGAIMKKASSSNKKVVALRAVQSMDTDVYLSAKKTGKSTITIQTLREGTQKLVVTVKKPDFDTDLIVTENGIVFTTTNNIAQYFTSTVKCTLRDKEGEVLWQKEVRMKQIPGKTTYFWCSLREAIRSQIDLEKSTVEVTEFHRFRLGASDVCDLRYLYRDVSEKVKSSVTVEPEQKYLTSYDVFKIKLKNPAKNRMIADVYLLFYDEDGNLMRVEHESEILNGKKSGTVRIDANPAYDHYEMLIYGIEHYKE